MFQSEKYIAIGGLMNSEGDFTAPQLASLCKNEGVSTSRQHITRLCRKGDIPGAYQIGGGISKTWVIPHQAAMDFIAEKKNSDA